MAKKAMNGSSPKMNGCESTVVPDEICSFSTTLRADLSWSDVSKRRESVVCSTDGGERRIVDRWEDKRDV